MSFLLWPLAFLGVAALVLAAALAAPLRPPPLLASIDQGAREIPRDGLPELSRYQARDGTWLAYREYAPATGPGTTIAVLAHGSSSSSAEMHAVGRALAAAGIAAVAIDARGHGASGTRGDIGYIGQLDDDLADLVAVLRKQRPAARFVLIGHSSGGGFASRIAAGRYADLFERYLLLSPYLGYQATTNRTDADAARWVAVDYPRVVALMLLWKTFGVDWAQSLPAIAFAAPEEAKPILTLQYSFRLMVNYGSPEDWLAPFRARGAKLEIIAGADDELMNASAYAPALSKYGVAATILPGVDHMGIVYQPSALQAIVEAARRAS